MNSKSIGTAGLAVLCIALAGCAREVSFSDDVQPILAANCGECHGATGEGIDASGFSVASRDSVMRGTKFGPVVIPGSAISSNLYLVVAGKTAPEIQMPPQHAEAWAEGRGRPLTESEIATIAAWIDQGAKDN